jgi:pyruvate formate lyase activating enzyme
MKHEAMFYRENTKGILECFLCNHRCLIAVNGYGICRQRKNINNKLFTYAYGEVVAKNIDPVEKKPLYHFLPGTKTFSIATPGCNFRCGFCQNWQISQVGAGENIASSALSPEEAVQAAIASGCASISYTYTEPTIFFEYSYDIARIAKEKGLCNIYVTNGYSSRQAIETISPYLDAANIDLKSFRDDFYRQVCNARLGPVLETIKIMKTLGIWIEITTLLLAGLNDSEDELRQIAEFIAKTDRNIPWHISRSHPDYKYQQIRPVSLAFMNKAESIGKSAGLEYVHLGNV